MASRSLPSRQLTILIDSNIFFSLESAGTSPAQDIVRSAEFSRLAAQLHVRIAVSASTRKDLSNAPHEKRKLRLGQLNKYYVLEAIHANQHLAKQAAFPSNLSGNDRIDLEILSALAAGAADWLVTEDIRLRKRAQRAGFEERVYSLADVVQTLSSLVDQPASFISVRTEPGYRIDTNSPFFDSLKGDYDGFTRWWQDKVAKEPRNVLVIGDVKNPEAIAVLKIEHEEPHGIGGKVLKVCTFKVSEEFHGSKRGELLLYACIRHARHNKCNAAYLEVLPRNEVLLNWTTIFGFNRKIGVQTCRGEYVLLKELAPGAGADSLEPLDHNIRYGPGSVKLKRVHLVPVQPPFHRRLFPEAETQIPLLPSVEACGNAIRKAYLCHANTRLLERGDTLLFLETGGKPRATVVGVVEETRVSAIPEEIVAFVGNRTVYTSEEIGAMCKKREVLAVLFRFDRVLSPRWTREELLNAGVYIGNVQTIQRARGEGLSWIRQRLGV